MTNARITTREEYANFLRQFEWAHFATFTAQPTPPDRLRHAFRQTIRRLERRAQGPVRYFVVLERGAADIPHMHALLTGTSHLRCEEIARSWWLGHSDVRRFDAEQGGIFYLTKSLHCDDADYDLSPKLNDCRPSSQLASHPGVVVDAETVEGDEFPFLKELRENGLVEG